MATTKLDLDRIGDGFFVGRKNAEGEMSKNARQITQQEIITMFSDVFEKYCAETKSDRMLIQTADGQMICALKVTIEQQEPAVQKIPAKKPRKKRATGS